MGEVNVNQFQCAEVGRVGLINQGGTVPNCQNSVKRRGNSQNLELRIVFNNDG